LIKYFAIENYRSIKKECVIDFDLNIPKNNPFPANTIIGFAGANASGKTTVLQALTFVYWFMQSSFLQLEAEKKIPIEPFYSLENEPSKFHLIFSKKIRLDKDQEEKFIDCEYILHLTKEKVIYEEINYYPCEQKRNIYTRKLNVVIYDKRIKPIDTSDLRSNCSIISFNKQFKSQVIALEFATYFLQSNITNTGLQDEKFNPALVATLMNNSQHDLLLTELIRVADIGIDSIFIGKQHFIEGNPQGILEKLEKVTDQIPKEIVKQLKLLRKSQNDNHQIKLLGVSELFFKHKIADSYVDFLPEQESSGTLQFLVILGKILVTLDTGTLLILDEIEIKLHQNLVAYLIGLFQNPSFNTKGAQLIFSFHNSYLMNILEPHQLWFTQKNDDGETEVFSANDFKDISKFGKEHLEELYRIGRFGAIPRGI